MSQNTKLGLGIVRLDQQLAGGRYKEIVQAAADILYCGLSGVNAGSTRTSLSPHWMQTSPSRGNAEESDILRHLPPIQDVLHARILQSEFFQDRLTDLLSNVHEGVAELHSLLHQEPENLLVRREIDRHAARNLLSQ
jgi:hypothetical protein